ncbi:MAPEG family protein [Ruegeria arenilitoris]|uniref:MAPEG family protein n=1 Tax=Ruegeria arenilitoris TaxID=1173585 RepID=UPI00147EA997|nr:MAPEG family protein [Ruegeria arenilitoris]
MSVMLLPVTFTFVSVLAIILIPMTGWVGLRRDKIGGVLRGDGDDLVLFKRIRIHGNLMENAPLFALVLGASEYAGLDTRWLWLAVAVFLAGRILHYALYDSAKRGLAMLVTLLPGLMMGFWLLGQIWF